jgi:hypothetical protein
MYQQAAFAHVVNVVEGDFEIVDGFGTGAGGDGGEPEVLAVNPKDLFERAQFTSGWVALAMPVSLRS